MINRHRYLMAEGEGGGEGTGEGGGEGTKAPALDWSTMRSTLPTDLREAAGLERYGEGETPSGLSGLVKSHLELQKLVGGEKVTKPGKDATIEDYARYYSELGRPDSAEEYDLGDFAPPEGMPWDPALQDDLMKDLFDAGLSTAQANQVLRAYTARTEESYRGISQSLQQSREESQQGLRKEWGNRYKANHELAERVFDAAFGDNVDAIAQMELPDGTMVGDNPHFIKGMFELGKRMSEGSLIQGLPPRGLDLTPESALAEIAQMEADPVKAAIIGAPSHPEHKQITERRDALYRTAYPEPS